MQKIPGLELAVEVLAGKMPHQCHERVHNTPQTSQMAQAKMPAPMVAAVPEPGIKCFKKIVTTNPAAIKKL